jgi:hypothetical protein
MLAPRTLTAEGMSFADALPGAVPRLNTVTNGL